MGQNLGLYALKEVRQKKKKWLGEIGVIIFYFKFMKKEPLKHA